MIRPITAVIKTEPFADGHTELLRVTRFDEIDDSSELDRDKWLWLSNAERDCHPLLYPRTMMCKKIERVTKTDHNSYELLIHRMDDARSNPIVTLDCKTFGNIEANPENYYKLLIFTFEEYFTEEEINELNEIYLDGSYDNLRGVPEF